METLTLGSALYSVGSGEKVDLTVDCVINVKGKPGITSSHRTASGIAKISNIATVFYLLSIGEIAAYESTVDSKVYVEIGDAMAIADGSMISWNSKYEDMDKKYHLIPELMYELSKFGHNQELKDCFKQIAIGVKSLGSITKEDLTLFCDSYYYGCAAPKRTLEVDTMLTEESIEAGFRAIGGKGFEKHELVKASGLPLKDSKYASPAAKTRKKKTAEKQSFYADCLEGKFVLNYEWDDEMKEYIPELRSLEGYTANRTFEKLVKKLHTRLSRVIERLDSGLTGIDAMGNDVINALLLGKPGTGKTATIYAVAAALGLPVASVVWSQNSDEEEGEGKTKIVDGHPQLCVTDLLRFHTKGGIIMNEEINLPMSSVTMGILGQATEFPYIIKKNGYESIQRHPMTVYFGAMNIGTAGSKELNQALSTRFKQKYILDDPSSEDFIAILQKKTGESEELCRWIYRAYDGIVSYLKQPNVNEEELCLNLSLRGCIGAIENIQDGDDPFEALEDTLVGAIAEANLELAREIKPNVFDNKRLLPEPTFLMVDEAA